MRQTLVDLQVHGPRGSSEMEALAGTGATFTKIPRSAIEKIGAESGYQAAIELGDGRTVTRCLALAEVEIHGVRRPVLVSVGEDEERPLVGYTTLESLGVRVNPVTHALEPTPSIGY